MRKQTPTTKKIKKLLSETFGTQHSDARIWVHKEHWGGVHIVIISDVFEKKGLSDRDEMVWPILETLPKRDQMQIRLCLLITHDEALNYFPDEEPKEADVAMV
ncbi:hypothetical protein FJZ31_20930 [Candidatus Poribacteria bacterium]|nr:hypothetical protein [Candidatus Poribacteria bacterium]